MGTRVSGRPAVTREHAPRSDGVDARRQPHVIQRLVLLADGIRAVHADELLSRGGRERRDSARERTNCTRCVHDVHYASGTVKRTGDVPFWMQSITFFSCVGSAAGNVSLVGQRSWLALHGAAPPPRCPWGYLPWYGVQAHTPPRSRFDRFARLLVRSPRGGPARRRTSAFCFFSLLADSFSSCFAVNRMSKRILSMAAVILSVGCALRVAPNVTTDTARMCGRGTGWVVLRPTRSLRGLYFKQYSRVLKSEVQTSRRFDSIRQTCPRRTHTPAPAPDVDMRYHEPGRPLDWRRYRLPGRADRPPPVSLPHSWLCW